MTSPARPRRPTRPRSARRSRSRLRSRRARALALVALVLVSLGGTACKGRRKPTGRYGIYHAVGPGENLYRIALAYGTDVEALRRANRLRDADAIHVGQKILVPGARWPREVGLPGEVTRPASSAPTHPPGRAEGGDPPRSPPPELHVRLRRPLQGAVTSAFGDRDGVPHTGIDISAPKGTPVGAAAAGTVKWTGEVRGYGKTVILDHGAGVATVYAHLDEILAEPGTDVAPSEPIGLVGQTGRATAPHLHFEVRLDGAAVDPLRYVP